jgi:carbon monoxide dehydrogenase subunit G
MLFVGIFGTTIYIDSTLDRPYGPLNLTPLQLSTLSYSKTVDVDKEIIFDVFSDIENYSNILPNNIEYVNNISEKLSIYDISLIEAGIKTNLTFEHMIEGYDKQIIKVTDGDAQGTTITQIFESLGNSTKISINIDLKTRGILTPFAYLPQHNANHAIDTIVRTFVDYSNRSYTQNEKIVDDLYREILERPVDPPGLAKFSLLLDEGSISLDEIRNILINSEEYTSKFLLSDLKDISEINIKTKNFLDEIYDITLRRDIDSQALQYFGSALENNKMSKKHITIELLTSKEFNSLPIETREINETYQLNENWQIINQTAYEINGKYPSKKIVRAYGIFFEKEIIEINDIINLFQK